MHKRNLNGASLAHLLTEALAAAPSVNWENQDVQIEREGKKIKLPNDPGPMPIADAISALERLQFDEEQETTVDERIRAYPLEAAVAFVEAMEELYGWAPPVPTPGFFGPTPPHFISVQVDVNEWRQVPWGSFRIPGVENDVQIMASAMSNGEPCLQIFGTVRKRERHVLLELAAKTREILKSRSIYRGKALHISTNFEGRLDVTTQPSFIDLRDVRAQELIMNRDVQAQIDVNINAPIEHTERVRKAGIPLKRGVLLEGRYGVGKTLTTRITARKCVDNGWTFITVDRAASLREALNFATRYQPAVVFVEDIDRATSQRDDGANDLLNTIDGILSKNAEVMVVMTTNHVELIEQAMLRPGRLDAVISVLPPDADAVQRLITLYARGLLRPGEPLDEVGQELAGNIPAVIREVVERSKLAMISQGHEQITQEDLLISARGMKAHLALLVPRATAPSTDEALGIALRAVLQESLGGETDPDEEDDLATTAQLNTVHAHLSGKIDGMATTNRLGIVKNLEKQEKIAQRVADIHQVLVR